ncbi:kinesin-domain-containing protein [Ramicandelaber brevisporus]|nr:kinesin-domain-containing protein [Ramicandelaber brevisporus]
MAATESRFKTDLNNLRNDYDDLKRVKRNLEQDLEERELQLTQQKNENVTLRGTISAQSANFLQVESDMRGLKLRLEATETTLRMREERINQLERDLDDANKNIEKMEAKIRDEEQVRRKLHNTIQELKGNIRVFCRVRPLFEIISEYIKFPECEFSNEIELLIAQDGKAVSAVTNGINPPKSHAFTFDRVFEPSATQAQVFEEISQLVQSALDGYPVCIFAYGQTSAGKTWTMEGAGGACTDESKMGMIPRAVRQIFETSEKLKSKGWVYTMEAQFVEIYNETVHDLLNPNGAGASGDINKYEIKHHPNGKTTVTNCTTAIIESPQTLQVLFARASKNRAVAATNCNDRSSRSHSVFTLRLHGKNSISEEVSEGVLNLVDLAGSERLSQSGSTGDRLKETKAINSSLSCLGDVISALANKDAHIPYRNSKLTYLLQNSLGGNSKTLMFVNVSPLKHSLNESLCSLRFAAKVNACNIGTARRVVKA